MSENNLEQKLKVCTDVEQRIAALEEGIKRIGYYCAALEDCLGIEVIPQDETFHLKINSPQKGKNLGVVANNYWSIKDIYKKIHKEGIIIPGRTQ